MQNDSPLVYDLEMFDTSNGACVAAARSSINGWTDYLAISPRQVSGVYGSSCGSALDQFASIGRPPDFIWGAWWNGNPDVFNMICVNSGSWVNRQRHKQYRDRVTETWNGVTLNVDFNSSDGLVYTK